MKLYTIKEILELDDKTPITSVKGTLIEVWPAKSFTYKKGDRAGEKGFCQNLKIEDETGSIDMKNWGEPLSKSDKGETFIFESHQGKKGWTGLSKETDTFKDPKPIINMNENAKIKNPDGASTETKGEKAKAPAPSRDPYEVAQEAMDGSGLATQCALKLYERLKDEFQAVMGHPPSIDQVISWGGQINVYLRDKGVLPALRKQPKAQSEDAVKSRDDSPPRYDAPPSPLRKAEGDDFTDEDGELIPF